MPKSVRPFWRATRIRRRTGWKAGLARRIFRGASLSGGRSLCRTQLERRGDNHVYIRACRVFALAFAGLLDEAMAAADGLIEAAIASKEPVHAYVRDRRVWILPEFSRFRT